MTESERHVMTIFSEALDWESAAERAAYLDQACGGDAALRERVEALLRAHGQVGGFLEAGHAAASEPSATVDAPPTLTSGAVIAGRYKLIEEIGEGGMGTVWMAQQTEPVKRAVAVKLIKPGMDSKQILARFEAERQALALMDHPNIAKVLDAGTTTGEPGGVSAGRPFFVMDLVKGKPITKYCDEHRLTPRQRLELFVPICQAVQHAHQKAIIHRDIKPSNILVAQYDGRPVPKVIDFGVAKAAGQQLTDRTLMTGFGVVVGTLEYMSPEQAELNQLDIDTRSDIYSLGVVLYELLTGSTPLDKERLKQANFVEILRVIREEDPPKPSTRLSSSTESLPSISAQRQMEPAKLTNLVRGELDWIVMKALDKDRNRRYESANGLALDIQRYLADEPVLACPPSVGYRLRKFARRNKTRLAIAFLILCFFALFGGTAGWVMRDRASRQYKVVNDLERALDRAELLQGQRKRAEAMAAFERVELHAGQAPSDPDRDARLAALKERLDADARDEKFITRFEKFRLEVRSQVNVLEGDLGGSYDELSNAFAEYGIVLGNTSPPQAGALIEDRPDAVRVQLVAALGEFWGKMMHDDPLRPWVFRVLEIADNDPWRSRLRKAAVDGDRDVVERLASEVDVRTQPPGFLLLAARSVYTNKSVRLALFRRIQVAYPNDLWANHDLAFELIDNRQYAEAVRYFTAALTLRPDNAGIYLNRGSALNAAGEVEASIADFRRALSLESNFALAHAMLGGALADKKQWDAALAECNEAIRLNPKLWQAWGNRGRVHQGINRLEESIADHSHAIKLNPQAASLFVNRCNAYNMLKQHEKAVADSTEAIRLDPLNHLAHGNHAFALEDLGRNEEAMAAYQEAIRLKYDYPEAHNNLANILKSLGRWGEAMESYHQALRLKADYPEAHNNLGELLATLGRREEAMESYRQGLRLKEELPEAYLNLANLLVRDGRFAEALVHFRRAEEMVAKIPDCPYPAAQLRRQCERQLELDGKLPDYLERKSTPASAEEGIELADLCYIKRLHRAAAGFFGEAFRARPALADDPAVGYRYNAACVAALAGRGQAEDADKLGDTERARLRRQALDWLREDLDAWGRLLNKEPDKIRPILVQRLRHWLKDADLAGVRALPMLAKLPEAERQSWHKLWDDVAVTLDRSEAGATSDKK